MATLQGAVLGDKQTARWLKTVPDRLLRLDDRDRTSPELVQGGLRSEQLVDGVGHPQSMIDAWDIPAERSSNEHRVPAKNGESGTRCKPSSPA